MNLPDIVLNLDESDRIFESESENDEIEVVYQNSQDSDTDTIQYLSNFRVNPLSTSRWSESDSD